MVDTRNRIVELVEYIKTFGIVVNLGKNTAQGNKGLFKSDGKTFRIDISKKLDDETVFKTLVHEFSHFIHFYYDNSLTSLDFILNSKDEELLEEMISLTVESIPKQSVTTLFESKNKLRSEIKDIATKIKQKYPNFKTSEPSIELEKKISFKPYKYLLKHDVVKVVDFFTTKIYKLESIKEVDMQIDEQVLNYLNLKSKQRRLKRINSRISRLNKYYNSPTELFARSLEMYICNPDLMLKKAPLLKQTFDNAVKSNQFPILNKIVNICI